jgi:hypothetical protein
MKELFLWGGATSALYVPPSLHSAARPTVDVDCVIEISSLVEYQKLESKMRTLGFCHDLSEGAPICRWLKGNLILDLMPTDSKILGFSNQWYQEGINFSKEYKLPNGSKILIFSFEYFIASKCEALLSRGIQDLHLSQDLEDILYIIDGRDSFFENLSQAAIPVRAFIFKALKEVSTHPSFESAARGNMPRGLSLERQNEILEKFTKNSAA